jgi:hypothetical protein
MSKYVYEDPIKLGYIQFKLTKKQHNSLFKYRQIKWTDKYEYYYNEHEIIIHKFYNWKAVLLQTIFFPVEILMNGIVNAKEIYKEILELYNQKESGSFSGDDVSSGTDKYNEIMDIIK